MIPMAGERFGPYEILGTLGRGGVGEVYRAWDTRLDREVALKILHDDYPQPGNRERFQLEARAASALNHPNICTIFDRGEKDGAPYLVMELLRGETLKQRLERGGLPAEEIAQFGMEIADALGAAHALGIVHRDIKPANVMLVRQPDGRSRAKVLDFGLAKLTGPLPGRLNHREEHLTVVGEAVGTVSYMSPEQARGDELDGRSDLFSLGVLMYEMATRRTPFHGSTTALLFVQLLNHDPDPIRDWNDEVPRVLEKVIFRLLEKDPGRRYQRASDVSSALSSIAAKVSSGRWRRATAPAVPLVRVEEPIARAALPMRPEFGRHPGVLGVRRGEDGRGATPRDSSSGEQLRSSGRQASGSIPAAARPVSGVVRPSAEGAGFALNRSSTRVRVNDSGRPQRFDSSSSVAVPVDTPVGGISVAVDEAAGEITGVELRRSPSWAGGHFLRLAQEGSGGARTLPRGLDSGEAAPSRLRRRVWVVVAGAVASVALAGLGIRAWRSSPAVLAPGEPLMITSIENHTGVQALDGSVAAGLEFAMAEMPGLPVRGAETYAASLRSLDAAATPASAVLARQAAQAAGAMAYLYGEVRDGEEGAHGTGAGYVVSVQVYDTATDRELARAEARAARTEEIPGAIDNVAERLRAELGDSSRNGEHVKIPLAREATGNLGALHAYASGVQAEAEGRSEAALKDYGMAVAVDPGFVQALIRISWLAHEEHAEAASSEAATRAASAAEGRSQRVELLAQMASQTNAQHDLTAAASAAHRLLSAMPHDDEAVLGLARVERRSGSFADALHAAEEGIAQSPRNRGMYREAELALIGLNRAAAAMAMDEKAGRMGLSQPEVGFIAAYLDGREDRVSAATQIARGSTDGPEMLEAQSTYLDSIGELTEGAGLSREAADAVRGQPTIAGAASAVRARGALDQALAGQCDAALELAASARTEAARPQEVDARLRSGLAAAYCGDQELAQLNLTSLSAGRDTNAVAMLRAGISLAAGHSSAALQELSTVEGDDGTLLLPYLRGLAHLAAQDPASAVDDFHQVLSARGEALLGGTNVYPLAEIGLARAAASAGDRTASRHAYGEFLKLWDGAGSGDPLRKEALSGSPGGMLSPRLKAHSEYAAAKVATEPYRMVQSASSRKMGASLRPHAEGLPHTSAIRQRRRFTAGSAQGAAQSYPVERKYKQVRDSDLE